MAVTTARVKAIGRPDRVVAGWCRFGVPVESTGVLASIGVQIVGA